MRRGIVEVIIAEDPIPKLPVGAGAPTDHLTVKKNEAGCQERARVKPPGCNRLEKCPAIGRLGRDLHRRQANRGGAIANLTSAVITPAEIRSTDDPSAGVIVPGS